MPRDLTFPVGSFSKRISIDVVTGANGQFTLMIHPSAMFFGTTSLITNSNLIPFGAYGTTTKVIP